MSNVTVIVVGMGSVFLTFVILYIVFLTMEKIFKSKRGKTSAGESKPEQVTVSSKVEEKTQDEPLEAVIVGAVMAYISSQDLQPSSQPRGRSFSFEERNTSWRKSGWKGARKWRASSGW
ncbi:OadG family protein [Pseudothermotoga sp.]|nr:OadG family protein [Pseudothermotoga sp.]MDW8140004.1 OadG family protein [Pseudothermotoga sp.]